ncbi:MAG: tryptophan--tRNA ligase [Candidatus ainarchaeum sp.]|nr:tryptophan--tRNA ligase [Candidatus ainarchaeum sp.]
MVQTVTPWEVKGEIDYKRLITEFGTKEINPTIKDKIEELAGGSHVLLRRNFFFSHRDLNLVLRDYEEKKGFFLYTGRGPSGPMHIGHIVPLLFTKWLQEKFGVNLYIQITDDEKFLLKRERSWEKIEKDSKSNILDICALGFDPDKTFVFRNSEYIKKIYPMFLEISRRITYSTVKSVFGFVNESNVGMISFPAIQMVPTFFEKKRCLIPSAIDQDPYWRVQRDIAETIGYQKAAAIHSRFLPPLTSPQGKMSASSEESAVWLNDDEKTVKQKVMKYAFSGGRETVEEHRRRGGRPEVDVSFQWLKIIFEENDNKISSISEDYKKGKMLTGELKEILVEKINSFLGNHRKNKEKVDVDKFMYKGKLAKNMWEKEFEIS